MYVDGPNGTRLCTEHNVEFTAPAQCPQCSRGKVPARAAASLAPEFSEAITDEVRVFEGLAEEAGEMMADDTIGDTARVAALRIRLSALKEASTLRMERAKAAYLDRLKNRRPAADALPDPREDFGTAALDDAFVAGDN